MVLEWAGVPETLQFFFRGIYAESVTNVEHASAARGQFAIMRSVRQCCPVSGFLFTMAFDPVFRCACAYADDFALATVSLGEVLPIVATAFATIGRATCMALNCKKCHWIQYENMTTLQLANGSALMSLIFTQCRSATMPNIWVLSLVEVLCTQMD